MGSAIRLIRFCRLPQCPISIGLIAGPPLRDITQLASVATFEVSTESFGYDSEGRVESKTLTLNNRTSYPFMNQLFYDELDRAKDVRYPAEYGNGTQPRKVVHHDYDVASRLTGLTVDGASHASNIVYNAASQTTHMNVGVSGANQITENYGYQVETGLLDSQTVVRGGATTLLNLSYDYLRPNTSTGRTGQLTKIVNNLNNNKNRSYSYDALGRLIQAQGGQSGTLWTQTYGYDNYGNRTSVSASGFVASAKPSCQNRELPGPPQPRPSQLRNRRLPGRPPIPRSSFPRTTRRQDRRRVTGVFAHRRAALDLGFQLQSERAAGAS